MPFSDYRRNMETYRQMAKSNMLEAQIRNQIQYDKGRAKSCEYKIGDLVKVKRAVLDTHKTELNENDYKLRSKYAGPFKVTKIISPTNVSIKINNRKGDRQNRTVNVSDIYIMDADGVDTDVQDIVEIIGKRNQKYGRGSRIEYLVKALDKIEHKKVDSFKDIIKSLRGTRLCVLFIYNRSPSASFLSSSSPPPSSSILSTTINNNINNIIIH
ncbi:hypothetical protein DFA_02472 [Cavenderia fasciculata]|uniref:Uncharacterized protein n=1 Tax=Cavenderia fasciculata TaxID=261658 RepID=F4PZJ4_CACFS|nr:uncharacterized protein DFA_02472 [Cavenderia fasciculata]EGG19223.1 hypothetical protein DFA_02472 [Cavenderia fasciculata]|eukprot:XP_004366856.1 hypothetical protein DFA_02472 [Cavenderia fasciculata]